MNKHIVINIAAGILLLIGSASAVVWAMDGSPGSGRHMGPPPEAVEACKNKSEGTVVEITTPRGDTIKATCQKIDGQMVAVPEGGFRGQKVLPPSEGHGEE
jgi:hypothetical protein